MKTHIMCFFFLIYISKKIKCYEILAIFNVPSKSCHITGLTMAEILAEKGHNVTILTSYEVTTKPENFEHVFLSYVASVMTKNALNYYDLEMSAYNSILMYGEKSLEISKATYEDPELRKVIFSNNRRFDLVILDIFISDSLFYIAEYLQVPLLLYMSMDSNAWSNPTLGNPAPPSYIPDIYSQYSTEMGLLQRVDNSLIYLFQGINRYFYTLPAHNKIVQENFPGAPDISEYCYKPSVILVNSDTSVMDPIPKVPGIIDIGGFHIKQTEPLPKDLQIIMDEAVNGVVYFSLGSNIESKTMPKQTMQIILNVFSKFNVTFLWKWEDENFSGKPYNVIHRRWLPQNDILAHKNLKLFITHGGFHSLLEAVYHGVPCLALPIFLDQQKNSLQASKLGYADWLEFRDITENKLKEAMEKVLYKSSYTIAARKRSSLMRDKPIPQTELIEYWVNYVVKHKGAHHLKVASLKLAWYEYLLLDVITFILSCVILSLVSIRYIYKISKSVLFESCLSMKQKIFEVRRKKLE